MILLQEQKVFLSGRNTKNRRDGMVGLNRRTIDLMLDLVCSTFGFLFLFGTCHFVLVAGSDGAIFGIVGFCFVGVGFAAVLSVLFFEGCRGFVIWRMLVVLILARDQARHADVRTTNRC